MRFILGVDPGLSGAAALYNPNASIKSGLRWTVIDLPTIGDKSQRRINAPAFRDFVTSLDPVHAFIELATVMPGQGISSSGRYMRAAGAVEAIIAALNIPITFVTPQTWKKFHGLRGSDKEQSRAKALQLFPDASALLTRKSDHHKAEVMLLTFYAATALQQRQPQLLDHA